MKISGIPSVNDRQRLLLLILILAVVASFPSGITTVFLCETSFRAC